MYVHVLACAMFMFMLPAGLLIWVTRKITACLAHDVTNGSTQIHAAIGHVVEIMQAKPGPPVLVLQSNNVLRSYACMQLKRQSLHPHGSRT